MFKAIHMVGLHNARAGGTTRYRLLTFSDYCIAAMCERFSPMYQLYLKAHFLIKIFLFEHWFWAYERLYGFMRVSFDKDTNKLIEQTSAVNYQ